MKKSIGIGIGTSSIMTIFFVLCLTIFSTLCLLYSNSSYKQSVKYKESIENYYEVDSIAIKEIARYRELIDDKQLILNDGDLIEFEVEMNENTVLKVVLLYENEVLVIENYQLVTTEEDYGSVKFDV